MTNFEKLLAAYDYPLKKETIALSPREPRDSAKLLVYDPHTEAPVRETTFAQLTEFLPQGALLVFNNTKVIPARIYATKKTGGVVEILCTELNLPANTCTAKANKKLYQGETLQVGDDALTVLSTDGEYVFKAEKDLANILKQSGTTPIPPYLKHTPLSEETLRERYQTVFAKHDGSIAAPTASLHFTDDLLRKIHAAGIETIETTLQVNLGTFAPLTEEMVLSGQLHEERYEITPDAAHAIMRAKSEKRPIIAVGTTAARTLESAAQRTGITEAGTNTTRLFIREGYQWKIVDGLITNFHVPRSSLLMLVAALIGREKLFELYTHAQEHDFTFLSFGDGMLLLPKTVKS